jgi:hypothetical protein
MNSKTQDDRLLVSGAVDISKSSTNPRLRSPTSNKSEAKMDVSFLLQPQFDPWEAVATSLISGRPHSSIHMPFGQNSQKIKF